MNNKLIKITENLYITINTQFVLQPYGDSGTSLITYSGNVHIIPEPIWNVGPKIAQLLEKANS